MPKCRMLDFDAVYAAHQAKVLAHCIRLAGAEDGPDVAQQVWTRVFRRLDRFRGDAEVTTWLYVVTRNTAISHHRLRVSRGLDRDLPLIAAASVQSEHPSPLEGAIHQQQRAALAGRISRLRPDWRAALGLWLTGQSFTTSAAHSGVPTGTIKSRTFRAIACVTGGGAARWASKPFAGKSADSVRAS